MTVTWPSLPPWQLTGDVVSEAEIAADGWVIVVVAGAVQPLLSLTVTVCEPLARPLKVAGEVHELKPPPSRSH